MDVLTISPVLAMGGIGLLILAGVNLRLAQRLRRAQILLLERRLDRAEQKIAALEQYLSLRPLPRLPPSATDAPDAGHNGAPVRFAGLG